MPMTSPGVWRPWPMSTSVPTIERTICQQNAVARISYRNTPSSITSQCERSTRRTVVEPSGPLRQNAAKSCSPRKGSAPRRSRESSISSGTHHAYRARNGSGAGRLTHRVPVRAGLRRVAGVEIRCHRACVAHHDLGAQPAVDRCEKAGRDRLPPRWRSSPPGPMRGRRHRFALRRRSHPRRRATTARAPRGARLRPFAVPVATRTRGSPCRRTQRPARRATRCVAKSVTPVRCAPSARCHRVGDPA